MYTWMVTLTNGKLVYAAASSLRKALSTLGEGEYPARWAKYPFPMATHSPHNAPLKTGIVRK